MLDPLLGASASVVEEAPSRRFDRVLLGTPRHVSAPAVTDAETADWAELARIVLPIDLSLESERRLPGYRTARAKMTE